MDVLSGLGASDHPKCSHAAARKGERNLLGFKFLCHRSHNGARSWTFEIKLHIDAVTRFIPQGPHESELYIGALNGMGFNMGWLLRGMGLISGFCDEGLACSK